MSVPAPIVSPASIEKASAAVIAHIFKMMTKHGPQAYASRHESLGVITEEYFELVDAIKANDGIEFDAEALDLACAAMFHLAGLFERAK